jgi:hypothetical protein
MKGTVSRDFRPYAFSANNTTGSSGSKAEAVSNIDSYFKIRLCVLPHSARSIFNVSLPKSFLFYFIFADNK